jgi:hypothetical protein
MEAEQAYVYTKFLCIDCAKDEVRENKYDLDDKYVPAKKAHVASCFTDGVNRTYCENCSVELQGT